MKAIAILTEGDDAHPKAFRAVAGDRKAAGRTPGEALDALTSQPGAEQTGAAVVVQLFQPDSHFTAEQSERLSTLMARWRTARDTGSDLPPAEQEELERLVEQELQGSAERSAEVSREFEAAQELRRRPAERGIEPRHVPEAERHRAGRFRVARLLLSIGQFLAAIVCGAITIAVLPSGTLDTIVTIGFAVLGIIMLLALVSEIKARGR